MASIDTFERGRVSFERKDWAEAYAQLSAGEGATTLGPEDLERLAIAAYLIGKDADCEGCWIRAHQGFLDRGSLEQAARCAFWFGDDPPEQGRAGTGCRLDCAS